VEVEKGERKKEKIKEINLCNSEQNFTFAPEIVEKKESEAFFESSLVFLKEIHPVF
jgi:hypothetical protein